MNYDVIIVGAGVTGLSCAKSLQDQGLSCLIIDKSEAIGGRIQTDKVNGFLLDRGFQVLQTGYPDLDSYLNMPELDVSFFAAGVTVRHKGSFHTIADPRKHPRFLFSTLFSPLGSISDKLALIRLSKKLQSLSFTEIFTQKEYPTKEYLSQCGFSHQFIETFFKPFFTGATLENSLTASSRVLQYVMKLFSEGGAGLPVGGMGAIPQQLFNGFTGEILLEKEVVDVEDDRVLLRSGEVYTAQQIVIALPEVGAAKLVKEAIPRPSVSEVCFYFSSPKPLPFKESFLILNGDGTGPINNIALPARVQASYSSSKEELIAVVVVDEGALDDPLLQDKVLQQAESWFGYDVRKWKVLARYDIQDALPSQAPPTKSPYQKLEVVHNIIVCGESSGLPGLQWALDSGKMAASAVLELQKR